MLDFGRRWTMMQGLIIHTTLCQRVDGFNGMQLKTPDDRVVFE
jgi:hypothetical protein